MTELFDINIKSTSKFLSYNLSNFKWEDSNKAVKNLIQFSDFGVLVESINENLIDILPEYYSYRFANKINKSKGTTIYFNNLKYDILDQFCFLILKNYPHIILGVILKDKLTNKKFVVIGIQLESGNKKHEIREIQTGIVINKISKYINEDIPIIIASEYNCSYCNECNSSKIFEQNKYKKISISNNITSNNFCSIFIKGDIESNSKNNFYNQEFNYELLI